MQKNNTDITMPCCSKDHPMVHVCSVVCKKFFLGVEMEGPGKYCRQKSPNERALSAFSFALFAASVPLSRQRRMRKKGNYLNTKRKKEGKKERKNFCGIHYPQLNSRKHFEKR